MYPGSSVNMIRIYHYVTASIIFFSKICWAQTNFYRFDKIKYITNIQGVTCVLSLLGYSSGPKKPKKFWTIIVGFDFILKWFYKFPPICTFCRWWKKLINHFALGTLNSLYKFWHRLSLSISPYILFHFVIWNPLLLHILPFRSSVKEITNAHHHSQTQGEQTLWLAGTGSVAAAVPLDGSPAYVP